MRMRAALGADRLVWLAVVLVLCCCAHLASGYVHGDAVSALKRSLYREYRSEYSELPESLVPRFGVDQIVRMVPVDPAKTYDSQEELKISFSFDHDRFLTPWITFTDGRGEYLHYVSFEFEYLNDHITSMRWSHEFQPPARRGHRPDVIFVRYQWRERVERDSALGFDLLMLVACVTAWASAVLVLMRSDPVRRAPSIKDQ